jgi:ferredoxin-nitrite reductase
LFEASVGENRIIPLIEAIARVYAARTPAGKRLKNLLREIGEEGFRRLVAHEPAAAEELPAVTGLDEHLALPAGQRRILARIEAGSLTSDQLLELADFADRWADGIMLASADQNVAFHIPGRHDLTEASAELSSCSFTPCDATFVVCPGNHECRMGLSATRDVARAVLDAMGPELRAKSWALSGCPNSCTQPQLTDFGIISSSLPKNDAGERTPRFDLLQGGSGSFADVIERDLTLDGLCARISQLN